MLKTFVSYKWEGEAHNHWVEKFAGDLRAAGIDAQLDKWEIRAGDSLTEYMTSRIDEASVILCIITDEYVKNVEAPHGHGGATKFEMQMAVSRRTAGDKVRLIGIYRQGSRPPHYLRDHLYVDFRDDDRYGEQLQELVDDLRGKSKRPPLGVPQMKEFDVWKNSIGLEMVFLPAGTFLMGSPESDVDASNSEKPRHSVRITQPFLMGIYPVTQQQYLAVELTNPSKFKGDDRRPVEKVHWIQATVFCNRLSQIEHLPLYYGPQGETVGGVGYRLPTEAEWEYACRAGSDTAYCFGHDPTQLGQYAWFTDNSERTTHPVGEKKPNAWGLYDMHGNVFERCSDFFGDDYYGTSPEENPCGPSKSRFRVVRGGQWSSSPQLCRSACRPGPEFRPRTLDDFPDLGFRVARSSVWQDKPVSGA